MARSKHPLYKAIEEYLRPTSLQKKEITIRGNAEEILKMQSSWDWNSLRFWIIYDLYEEGIFKGKGLRKAPWTEVKKIIERNLNTYLIDPNEGTRKFARSMIEKTRKVDEH